MLSTRQVRNCCSYLMQVISKFQHHNAHILLTYLVLDIVVNKNITLSNVIFSDIPDSDYLPIIFHILDHVRTKNVSAPFEKFTDWKRFQSLASNVISPRIEINSGAEAHRAARAFTASIASAYSCRPVR
jgi:hypothetical protein